MPSNTLDRVMIQQDFFFFVLKQHPLKLLCRTSGLNKSKPELLTIPYTVHFTIEWMLY